MHFYDDDGRPVYDVACSTKKGASRPTRIKDARVFGLKPSVTEIMKVANKNLDYYKQQQLLSAVEKMEPEDFLIPNWKAQVILEADRHRGDAAEAGAVIHNVLECYFKGCEYEKRYEPLVGRVHSELDYHFGHRKWIAEASFCNYGYGGKVDLHTKDILGVVVDYKVKSNLTKKKIQQAATENCMQLAAYRLGLGKENAQCANIYIDPENLNHPVVRIWTEKELERGENMFKCLRTYWYLLNDFPNKGWF